VFWPILEEKPDDQGPGRNPMTESQAHKDWRKAKDDWAAAQAQWEKDDQKWWDDKTAWEAQNAREGKSEFYPVPEPKKPPPPPPEPDSHDAIRPQDTHMEIRIAWSEFFDGRWSSKEVSSLTLTASSLDPEQYVFQAVPLYDGTLHV